MNKQKFIILTQCGRLEVQNLVTNRSKLPLKSLRKNTFLSFLDFSGPKHSETSGGITSTSAPFQQVPHCVSVFVLLAPIRTPVVRFTNPSSWPSPAQQSQMLSLVPWLITSAKSLCPNKVTLWSLSRIELGTGEGRGIREETIYLSLVVELEALFKHKYTPKSVSFNAYGCSRDCVRCMFFKITMIILWVDLIFHLHIRMPRPCVTEQHHLNSEW